MIHYIQRSQNITSDDKSNIVINRTKNNYVRLRGLNTTEFHNSFRNFMVSYKVWSIFDNIEIIQCNIDNRLDTLYDISFILEFYDMAYKAANRKNNSSFHGFQHNSLIAGITGLPDSANSQSAEADQGITMTKEVSNKLSHETFMPKAVDFIENKNCASLHQLFTTYTNTIDVIDIDSVFLINECIDNDITYSENKYVYDTLFEQITDDEMCDLLTDNVDNENFLNIGLEIVKNGVLRGVRSDKFGSSILQASFINGYAIVVRELIRLNFKLGINYLMDLEEINDSINYFVKIDAHDIIKYLIDEEDIHFHYMHRKGYNLLYYVCKHGNINILRYLFEKMNLVPHVEDEIYDLYSVTARFDIIKCFKYLLINDNRELYLKKSKHILYVCLVNDSIECFKYFIKKNNRNLPISYNKIIKIAIKENSRDILDYVRGSVSI